MTAPALTPAEDRAGRLGIGVELKPTYYRQAVRNLEAVGDAQREQDMFSFGGDEATTRDIDENKSDDGA